ncbi:MAG: hypothetical protein GEV10_20880 [Streptosporangiales bacterium]|nr:hypothetical protein [Streptosporangiales bacterium]
MDLGRLLGGSTTPPVDGYVLYGRRSLGGSMATLVGLMAFGAVTYFGSRFVGDGDSNVPVFLLVFWGIAFVLGLVRSMRRPQRLRVDRAGVLLGAVTVPWPSVWHVVVLRPEPVVGAFRTDLPAQVGVRLNRGAPLPSGVDALITDPDDPLAIPERLRSHVSDAVIDVEAFRAAVARYAPPSVTLAERVGDQEHVLPR